MIEIEKNKTRVEVMSKINEIQGIHHRKEGQEEKESFLGRFLKPFESRETNAQRMKVLVCEDCKILSKLLCKIMEKKGIEVTLTESPVHFLNKDRLEKFDFVITDNNMPYMKGTQFIEFVEKELKLHIPIYIHSGDSYLKNELPLTKVLRGIFVKGSSFDDVLRNILTDFKSYRDELNSKIEMKLAMTANALMA